MKKIAEKFLALALRGKLVGILFFLGVSTTAVSYTHLLWAAGLPSIFLKGLKQAKPSVCAEKASRASVPHSPVICIAM